MKHTLFRAIAAAGALLALVLSIYPSQVGAQATGPISQPFTLTAAGQRLPTLTLSNSIQTCSIVVYNGGGGFTIVPQTASDGIGNPTPTWVTATNVNSGSISATGSFTGNVTNQGLTSFGGVLSSLTSGTVTGVETCGSGIGGGSTVAVASIAPVTIAAPTDAAGRLSVDLNTTPLPAPTATVGVMLIDSAGTNKAAVNAAGQVAVQTPVPYPTMATNLNLGAVQVGPSTAPAAVNSAYTAVVDSNGRIATRACDATTSTQCLAVSAGGVASVTTPAPQPTVSPSPAALTDAPGLQVKAEHYLYNLTTFDAAREAPSPAPVGLPASAYNSSSLVAPIICNNTTQITALTVNTVTTVVGGVSGKSIYVCWVDFGGIGTSFTVGVIGYGPVGCASLTGTLYESVPTYSTTNMQINSPVGAPLFTTPSTNQSICAEFLGSTLTTSYAIVNWTQF